jgi:hypothetical protein
MRTRHRRSVRIALLVLMLAIAALAIPANAATKRIPNFGAGCNPTMTTPGVAVTCYGYVDAQLQEDPTPTGRLTFTVPSFKGSVSPTSCDAAAGFCNFTYTPKGTGNPTRKDTITIAYSGDSFWASRKTTVVVAVPAKLPPGFGASCNQPSTTPGVPVQCSAFIYATGSNTPAPTGTITFTVPSFKGSVSPTSCDAPAGFCSFSYTPKGSGSAFRKDTITASYPGDSFWGSTKATIVVQVPAS